MEHRLPEAERSPHIDGKRLTYPVGGGESSLGSTRNAPEQQICRRHSLVGDVLTNKQQSSVFPVRMK